MSPRLRIWGACRALARSRPAPRAPFISVRPRWYSTEGDNNHPPSNPTTIPSANAEKPQSEAVAKDAGAVEESAAQEADEPADSTETLDDATLEQLFFGGRTTTTSSNDGGLTTAQEETLYREGKIPPADEAEALNAAAEQQTEELEPEEDGEEGEGEVAIKGPGHKFGVPVWPWPEGFNQKKRYHPVLEQITRLLMKDGKLSAAQRNVATVMNFLRTAPAPIYSPKFPLLPGTPPAAYLPLNPILYLTVAIDSVAPLIKVRNVSGAGGGGRALEVPMPLALRQRRRVAFQWILDVVNRKPSKGSGRKQFPVRIAEEIIAVVEGRSGVWDKRKQVHKLGTASRANVASLTRRKR